MSAHPVSDRRRGWCPGVRRPMETGDGLLVRLHPFAGRLTADQARLIAEAAREFGNGHLDITARGNLQIRGVSDETYPGLLALLEREGLAEPEGEGPNRLTIVSPLAGLDRIDRVDALALAQAIEDRAGHLDGLPAKFFVAVDGGGSMPLDAHRRRSSSGRDKRRLCHRFRQRRIKGLALDRRNQSCLRCRSRSPYPCGLCGDEAQGQNASAPAARS